MAKGGQGTNINATSDPAAGEEKYRLFADATEEGLIIHDYDRVLAANRHFTRLFGYTPEQVQGMDPFIFVAPADRVAVPSFWDESRGEVLAQRADGSTFPVEFSGQNTIFRGQRARIVRVRDLTRRRRAKAILNASEERFRATFELAAVGIAHVATNGTWLRVNRHLCEMTGYSHEELLKKTFLDITHPDDLNTDIELLDAALNGKLDSYSMEKRYIRKNGTILWVNLTTSLIKDVGSNSAYFISIVEDIGTRKAMEDTLRQSEKMDVIGQLTSSIAHDFGNFLNVIKGNLQLLEPYQISSRPSDYLKSALAGADLAENLILQLLSFSRRQEPEFEPIDVNGLIQNVRGLLRRAASDRILLKFLLDERGCPALCDRAQLETALFNLVLNARDALGDAKGEITIKTAIATDPGDKTGRFVQIDVSDDGPGMSPDVAARASEPFFTTKGVGEGTGLGLSQVARCVTQMNGFLDIDSAEGAGTTIRLFLPLHQKFR